MNTADGAADSFARFKATNDAFFRLIDDHRGDMVPRRPEVNATSAPRLANRNNWFTMFAPESWSPFRRGGNGVHFALLYRRDAEQDADHACLALGVEKPIQDADRDPFKARVVDRLAADGVELDHWTVWSATLGPKKKLLRSPLVPLDENSAVTLFRHFVDAEVVIPIVHDELRQWASRSP